MNGMDGMDGMNGMDGQPGMNGMDGDPGFLAVYVNAEELTVPKTGFVTMNVNVPCDAGDIAVGGGYECRSAVIVCQEAFHLQRSFISGASWDVIAFFIRPANPIESLVLEVRVVCLDITP